MARPLLFAWVALIAPGTRALIHPAIPFPRAAIIALVAAVAVYLTPPSRWGVRLLLIVSAAVATDFAVSTQLASMLVGSLLLAVWVPLDRPPLPVLARAGAESIAPVVVLCTVSAVISLDEFVTWQPLAPLAAAAALVVVNRVSGGRLHELGRRFGDIVAGAIGAIGFGTLATAIVTPSGLMSRLRRSSPPDLGRGKWVELGRRPTQSRSLWSLPRDARPPSKSPWRRAAGPIAITAVAAGLVAVLTMQFWLPAGSSSGSARRLGVIRSFGTADAVSGERWFDGHLRDLQWVFDERVALQPFHIYRLRDVETSTINVADGRRSSWRPGPCDCRRLRVWVYGGSTVFGIGQRDEHTIASELARVADEQGITLDVENRGIPGQLHWRSALRFAWDLTTDAAPDLVVFYDGPEEVHGELELTHRGIGNVRAPFEPYLTNVYEDSLQIPPGTPETVPGARFDGWPTVDELERPPGGLAIARYERSRIMTRNTAATAQLPTAYFWAPSRFSEPERLQRKFGASQNSDAPTAPGSLAVRSAAFTGAPEALPSDVTDLSATVATTETELFLDDFHHAETASNRIAIEMFRVLRPELERLIGEP